MPDRAHAPVALQMYTLRDLTKDDFVGTLRSVARIGYGGIELAGFPDMPASELAKLLGDLGVRAAGAHVALPVLQNQLEGTLDYCATIGCSDVACPFLPAELRQSEDDWRRVADTLNGIGRRCKERDVQLSYHNHAFELDRFDGKTGLEILFDAADPGLVQWEADVYWVEYAGVNAADLLRTYKGRAQLIHIKDMTRDDRRTFAEVGEGRIDFGPIFAAGDAGGARWYIVEQDRCERPPLESVELSLEHLRAWGRA